MNGLNRLSKYDQDLIPKFNVIIPDSNDVAIGDNSVIYTSSPNNITEYKENYGSYIDLINQEKLNVAFHKDEVTINGEIVKRIYYK